MCHRITHVTFVQCLGTSHSPLVRNHLFLIKVFFILFVLEWISVRMVRCWWWWWRWEVKTGLDPKNWSVYQKQENWMGFSFICICPWDSIDGNLHISQFYTTFHRAETFWEADLYFSRLQQNCVPKFGVTASAVTADSRDSWFGIHVIGRWTRKSLLDAAGRDICWLDSTSAVFSLPELAASSQPFSTESQFHPCCCPTGWVAAVHAPTCYVFLCFIWPQAFVVHIIQSFCRPVFHLHCLVFATAYNQCEQFALLKSALLCFNVWPRWQAFLWRWVSMGQVQNGLKCITMWNQFPLKL